MPKRAVILSGSLGLGHDVISEVVAGSLAGLGWQSRTLDCMGMLGERAGWVGGWMFRRLTAMPGVYDGLHFAHLRMGSRLAGAMDRAATSRLVPALRAELRREPADLIIAVFATGASAAAKLAGPVPGVRTIVLCTDAVPHSTWVDDGVDLFLVTSAAAAAFVRRYDPRARIWTVPPPVRAPRVHPFGFTERIAELMTACDVVVTLPGATTCSEARVVGRGLVLVDAMPGHGRENLLHELELGGAEACNPRPSDLAASVLAALDRVEHPLPSGVRPAGEWDQAFAAALAGVGTELAPRLSGPAGDQAAPEDHHDAPSMQEAGHR